MRHIIILLNLLSLHSLENGGEHESIVHKGELPSGVDELLLHLLQLIFVVTIFIRVLIRLVALRVYFIHQVSQEPLINLLQISKKEGPFHVGGEVLVEPLDQQSQSPFQPLCILNKGLGLSPDISLCLRDHPLQPQNLCLVLSIPDLLVDRENKHVKGGRTLCHPLQMFIGCHKVVDSQGLSLEDHHVDVEELLHNFGQHLVQSEFLGDTVVLLGKLASAIQVMTLDHTNPPLELKVEVLKVLLNVVYSLTYVLLNLVFIDVVQKSLSDLPEHPLGLSAHFPILLRTLNSNIFLFQEVEGGEIDAPEPLVEVIYLL